MRALFTAVVPLLAASAAFAGTEKYNCETAEGFLLVDFKGGRPDGASLSVVDKALVLKYRRNVPAPLVHIAPTTDLREIRMLLRAKADCIIAIALEDTDKSGFHATVNLQASAGWTKIRFRPADFKPNPDQAVKKPVLDPSKLGGGYVIVDAGLFQPGGAVGENILGIDEIEIDRGPVVAVAREPPTKTTYPPRVIPTAKPPATRSFYLAMTPFPYDASPDAAVQTCKFVREHTDMVAHHFDDGVPWGEMAVGVTFPPEVEQRLAFRIERFAGHKSYVAATPLNQARDGLADVWGREAHMPRVNGWRMKDLDDPAVIDAYLNYCRELIKRFKPEFFTYAVEANILAAKAPARWPKFVALAKAVYPKLKREFPGLPILFSIAAGDFHENEKVQRAALAQALPYTDFIAVSAYPYLQHGEPGRIPADYFSKLANLTMPRKPLAIVETGAIAEDLTLGGLPRKAAAGTQNEYMNLLLAEAVRLNAKLVVWFVSRDYDALYDKLPAGSAAADLARLWKDTGLADGEGKPRAALTTWDGFLIQPRK
jgi:hypothetical protein